MTMEMARGMKTPVTAFHQWLLTDRQHGGFEIRSREGLSDNDRAHQFGRATLGVLCFLSGEGQKRRNSRCNQGHRGRKASRDEHEKRVTPRGDPATENRDSVRADFRLIKFSFGTRFDHGS